MSEFRKMCALKSIKNENLRQNAVIANSVQNYALDVKLDTKYKITSWLAFRHTMTKPAQIYQFM